MEEKGNIDPTLRVLGSRARYQMLQMMMINIGSFGAAYQLLDNIFIGRDVTGEHCSAPDNRSASHSHPDVNWHTDNITYNECEIIVSKDNSSSDIQRFSCMFGYDYDYPRELSFRTEFDLVCDRKLLGSLTQTLVIIGQGIGAVLSTMVSDRYGRKMTLIGSQCGLLVLGVAIGAAPNYVLLAIFKFIVGGFQQGVLTGMTTMCIELFPKEHRNLQVLVSVLLWAVGATSMALFAFLLRAYPWRYLQYGLSAVSLPTCLLQLWYLDESLRWLVANGKKEAAVKILERAARINGKDITTVLRTLHNEKAGMENPVRAVTPCEETRNGLDSGHNSLDQGADNPAFTLSTSDLDYSGANGPKQHTHPGQVTDEKSNGQSKPSDVVLTDVQKTLDQQQTEKLTVLDIFRHRRLLFYSVIIWLAWYTTSFSYFSLYLMSTSLNGNRFLNYFLTALMEAPAGVVSYFIMNRFGRMPSTRVLFVLTGVGLISSGVFRVYEDYSALGTLSVVTAMVGTFGAACLFGAVFFFTPEIFPTNMRNQALGLSSFTGRLGGMLGPFMSELADIAVWAPGALVGSLCFIVAILLRFLPETRGRELPHRIEDIKKWRKEDLKKPGTKDRKDSTRT